MKKFPQRCSPLFCMVLSSLYESLQWMHLYLSYIGPQWCPVLSVMMHFLWSPVSMDKSQPCCQNSRTVSAESICKVSSWTTASSRAIQYPVISRCLWPPSAMQRFSFFYEREGGEVVFFSFFTAVLRITLISHQSASINSTSYTKEMDRKCPFCLFRLLAELEFLNVSYISVLKKLLLQHLQHTLVFCRGRAMWRLWSIHSRGIIWQKT